jgi:hypothetical protein
VYDYSPSNDFNNLDGKTTIISQDEILASQPSQQAVTVKPAHIQAQDTVHAFDESNL